MNQSALKNYRLLLGAQYFRAVTNFAFWMCSYISLEQQGLTDKEIVPLFLILPIVTLVSDLPSGVYADRVSCKASLYLSGGFDLAAFACLMGVSLHPALAAFGLLFKGLGYSFENGAANQLTFESSTKVYGQLYGSKRSSVHIELMMRFGSITGGGIGGYFVNSNPTLPWLISIISILVSFSLLFLVQSHSSPTSSNKNVRLAAKDLMSGLSLIGTVMVAPLFLFKAADGFRTGTEGVLLFPFLNMVFHDGRTLALIPFVSSLVRLPIIFLTWKGKVSIPDNPGVYSNFSYLFIGILIVTMASTKQPSIALIAVALNFGLYTLRDIWFRHWENQISTKLGHSAVTYRSTLSTVCTASQLLGTLVLNFLATDRLEQMGLIIAGTSIVGLCSISLALLAFQRYPLKIRNTSSSHSP